MLLNLGDQYKLNFFRFTQCHVYKNLINRSIERSIDHSPKALCDMCMHVAACSRQPIVWTWFPNRIRSKMKRYNNRFDLIMWHCQCESALKHLSDLLLHWPFVYVLVVFWIKALRSSHFIICNMESKLIFHTHSRSTFERHIDCDCACVCVHITFLFLSKNGSHLTHGLHFIVKWMWVGQLIAYDVRVKKFRQSWYF